MEYDKKFKILVLNFYKDINYFEYFSRRSKNDNIWGVIKDYKNVWFKRIKDSLKILFNNRITLSNDFILRDVDHINDFIEALKEAKQFCLEDKNENKN